MVRSLKRTFIVLVLLSFTLTGVSWAATTGTTDTNITASSSASNGGIADVSPMSGSYTVTRGAAQVIEGVELFKIELGKQSFSNQVDIYLSLMNPKSIGKSLNNPNAYIEVAVWYKNASGTHQLDDGTSVSKDESSEERMSQARGSVVIDPDVKNEKTLYVLATIKIPGGSPPGQQSQVDDLKFAISIRR